MTATTSLRGHIALVTGGSRGIGAAVSRALADAGADIAVNYRERADEAKALSERLREAGAHVIAVQADVSRADQVAELVATVKLELGPIDILVNNAGIASTRGVDDLTETDFD